MEKSLSEKIKDTSSKNTDNYLNIDTIKKELSESDLDILENTIEKELLSLDSDNLDVAQKDFEENLSVEELVELEDELMKQIEKEREKREKEKIEINEKLKEILSEDNFDLYLAMSTSFELINSLIFVAKEKPEELKLMFQDKEFNVLEKGLLIISQLSEVGFNAQLSKEEEDKLSSL